MSAAPFGSAHVTEIQPVIESEPGEAEWKPVRHHFGIRAFGVNAVVAGAEGQTVVEEHTEGKEQHEELYVVASGRATFTVAGEQIDAPAGTLVFVRDPAVVRSAIAGEAGTTVLAVGARPGTAFTVSPWEQRYVGA